MSSQSRALLIVSVLLFLSIAGHVVTWRIRDNEKTRAELSEARNQIEIAKHKALSQSYADKAREVDSVRTLERDSSKVVVRALKEETRAYKKTIAVLRPLVAPRIDSVPVLRDFIAAQDSTILKQDSAITVLEGAILNEISKAQEIDLLKRKEIGELVLMTNGLQESLVNEQAETRKYKKQADKRFNLGVGTGYGVTSTGGEIRTGPTVNVAVYYRLFRF